MPAERRLKVALVSLGCPKNLVDSEVMLAHLARGGCLVGAPADDADVIVVNTCAFLSAARDESLDAIREAIRQKRRGRARRVVVAGCLCNRDGQELYKLMRDLADEDRAILFYSTDYAELIGCCDRVAVMYDGRIVTELAGDDITEEALVAAALNITSPDGDTAPEALPA